jgi:hypothetical protein
VKDSSVSRLVASHETQARFEKTGSGEKAEEQAIRVPEDRAQDQQMGFQGVIALGRIGHDQSPFRIVVQ